MPGHCIFAITVLGNFHVAPQRLLYAFHLSAFVQIQHSKFLKIWNIQSSHLIQNMSKCISTFIAKFLSIRHRTNSQ